MPLLHIRDDITKMDVDAVIVAMDSNLWYNGDVETYIRTIAGPIAAEQLSKVENRGCGSAAITNAGTMPCKYLIQTVAARWLKNCNHEWNWLNFCYTESLRKAIQYGCTSIAIPLASIELPNYPKETALRVVTEAVLAFLDAYDLTVYIVTPHGTQLPVENHQYEDLEEYIRNNETPPVQEIQCSISLCKDIKKDLDHHVSYCKYELPIDEPETLFELCSLEMPFEERLKDTTLQELLDRIDESFSQMLLRKITEQGMTDAQCYKKANIDRKHFSKIRADVQYKPSKQTAIAFAIALELPLPEAEDLLHKAGFALSNSNRFDIIVRYFIENGDYDVFRINEALFAFDQPLLGC